MAGNDAAVFHFMNPITSFRNRRIVRNQEKRFLILLDDSLE
jgi:hypothetical protein